MPAIIQNTPIFTPFSFEQYIAPLNAYKQEYDSVEKRYDEMENAASILEKLAADAPNSQAYRTYRDYIDQLRTEADALAYNGLTPGSRQRLKHLKTNYTNQLLPIMAGLQQWEKDKERQDKLKHGEILSANPYIDLNVDDYVGKNPNLRLLDLNEITADVEELASATASRIMNGYSSDTNKATRVATGYGDALQWITGMIKHGPDGQDSQQELKDLYTVLEAMIGNGEYTFALDDDYSEGITGVFEVLQKYGFDDLSNEGKEKLLSAISLGYNKGLKGAQQIIQERAATGGGSYKPQYLDHAPEMSQLIPLTQASEQAATDIETLGGVAQANGEFVIKNKHSYTLDVDGNKIDPITGFVSPATSLQNPQQIAQNYHTQSQKYKDSADDRFLNILEKYDPSTVEQIRNGTFTGSMDQVLLNVFKDLSTTGDKAAMVYTMKFDNEYSGALKSFIDQYIKSNAGNLSTANISATGKTWVKNDTISLGDKEKINNYNVLGVRYLATDPTKIAVQIEIPTKNQEERTMTEVLIPSNALTTQFVEAMNLTHQIVKKRNDFEAQYGKWTTVDPNDNRPLTQRTQMEQLSYLEAAADAQAKLACQQDPTLKEPVVKAKKYLELLQELSQQTGRSVDDYKKLLTDYERLVGETSAIYPTFGKNFTNALYEWKIKSYDSTPGMQRQIN